MLDCPSLRVMRWRNGALSGNDLGHEPGVGTTRTYQPREILLPDMPGPGLRSRYRVIHQEMSSEATSSSSQLKAVLVKRPRAEEEVQANKTMEHLNETNWSR